MNENKNMENISENVAENAALLNDEPILADDDIFALEIGETETPAEDDFFAEEESAEAELDRLLFGDAKPVTEEPTTAPKTETSPSAPAAGESTEEVPPTTEEDPVQEPVSNKLKFTARIDHEDVEAEIDESELPTLYQKATATDRYQAKLAKVNPMMERLERMAKANGYDTVEAMLDAQENAEREEAIDRLVQAGTPKEIAEDYVDRRLGHAATPVTETAPQQPVTSAGDTGSVETKPETPAARDFEAEVRELWSRRPDLKGTTIPSEVAAAAANGQNLTLAYLAYEAKQAKAEAETLRKENEIYKQNAASAAKAPVKPVTGGGATDTKPKDPFEVGFDSGW